MTSRPPPGGLFYARSATGPQPAGGPAFYAYSTNYLIDIKALERQIRRGERIVYTIERRQLSK